MTSVQQTSDIEASFLFQKIGMKWYIFTEKQNGSVIYSEMPVGLDPRSTKLELYDVIEEHLQKVRSRSKKSKEVSL